MTKSKNLSFSQRINYKSEVYVKMAIQFLGFIWIGITKLLLFDDIDYKNYKIQSKKIAQVYSTMLSGTQRYLTLKL